MSSYEQIRLAIYEAIDQVNGMPGTVPPLAKSPDTVLLGENGQLDSLVFVALITAVEETVQRSLERSIVVLDLFTDELERSCTVGDLARRITEIIDGA